MQSRKVSDILLITCAAAPALLLIDKKRRADAGVTGVMYIETIGITAAEIHIVKKWLKGQGHMLTTRR